MRRSKQKPLAYQIEELSRGRVLVKEREIFTEVLKLMGADQMLDAEEFLGMLVYMALEYKADPLLRDKCRRRGREMLRQSRQQGSYGLAGPKASLQELDAGTTFH